MITPGRHRPAAVAAVVVSALLFAQACSSRQGPRSAAGVSARPGASIAPGPTGSTSTTLLPVAAPVPAPASWRPCRNAAGPAQFDCATIRVPLDYRHPTLGTIGLAIDRRRASGTKVGSLLVNPGGPGESGVDLLGYEVSFTSKAILEHFDVVGFDPRGVGRSEPVTCSDGPGLDRFFDLDPAPTTGAGFAALVDAARSFGHGCQSRSGAILPYVSTDNAARDMDQIRQAVGDSKLSYLGFSYGTLLGATYAELFPLSIRAMALDGVIDPAVDPVTANMAQAAAFEKQLDAFLADCTAKPTCAWKPGGDLHAAFDALMARIRTRRLPGFGGRSLGPGEAFLAAAWPLYDTASWPALAYALNLAGRGSGARLLQLFDQYVQRRPDGSYANVLEAYAAVNCLDQPWPSADVLRQDAPAAAKVSPDFGVADLYGGLTCSVWPLAATGRPHAIRAAGSPPIVIVGSTGDPATPYSSAQSMAGELDHGVLVTRVGDGHTGYRSSACVRRVVDAYLVDLTVPATGTRCSTP